MELLPQCPTPDASDETFLEQGCEAFVGADILRNPCRVYGVSKTAAIDACSGLFHTQIAA